MNIPEELQDVFVSTPDNLGGSIRFVGTRMPAQALIDAMECGTIEEFLDGWPDVTREQAPAVIHWEQNQARQALGLELVH